ncbi:Rossmann-like and DUF2520 domain-containing protein [Polaribacter gangjinensis]|uniref:DUF2520 domain-containing protein n=1 Tax=Polaribacter gangjinensis TaxID=574710 RepID=A0A2S7WAH5_9FLAO|nr:DUF2520 domain-containing protein [Polaribacter gangjinensis]PQJ74587.1 hypothetical protein BTO13_04635 [Polaribacter gangjinensis]
MISILIVGKGNVGTQLYEAFKSIETLNVQLISSRDLNAIPKSDVTIIAVSDDAVATVSSQISTDFVVHTSGSVPLSGLKNNTRKGVFYPLQTFSKDKKVDYTQVPFCIEATTESDVKLLETLAGFLSKKIYHISSEQRKAIHVAAVFANNFTNHLYKIAHDICDTHQIPFEILHPLINETADKIKVLPPALAQTGPAIRKDAATIKNHLFLLTEKQQEIYTILTKSIQNDA